MDFPISLDPSILTLAHALGVRAEDIEEEFVRGSGAGGQKINKTSSTVHLRHVPSGIEVRMQKHREQSRNRASAYKLLILKIEEAKKGKQSKLQQKLFKIRKQKQRRNRKSKEKMLEAKRKRAETKEGRRPIL
jgi:protein subunit release factor B